MDKQVNAMYAEQELDLKEIFYIIRTKWWIIALCFVIAVVASVVYSFFITDPVYSADALLFVGREADQEADPYNMAQIQVNQKLVMDYKEIIKSRIAIKEVISNLALDIKPESMQRRLSVSTVNDSRIFKISFEDTDPQRAADIVNEMSQVIIRKAAEIVEVDNVRVVDIAQAPENPIKPNKKMNVAIAAVLGVMLGAGIIFVLEFFDNTIKSSKDIEKYLGLNIMGEIPTFEGERRSSDAKRKSNKYR